MMARRAPWSTEPCVKCGDEGLASRSEPNERPFVCDDCEMWERGYQDGLAHGRAKLARAMVVVEAISSGIRFETDCGPSVRAVSESRQGPWVYPDAVGAAWRTKVSGFDSVVEKLLPFALDAYRAADGEGT